MIFIQEWLRVVACWRPPVVPVVGNPICPLVRVCWGQTAKAPEGRDRQCHRKMDEKRMRQRLLQESEMMRQSGMMEKKRGSGLRE